MRKGTTVDPNETLARIRKEIANTYTEDGGNAATVIDLLEALDTWLSKAGFLPDAWTHNRSVIGELTNNDHLLTRAGRDLDNSYRLPYVLGVAMYVYPETPIFVRLHRKDHRAVVDIGTVNAQLALFLTTDQVTRLATLFAHVRDRLR
jgi:hypothetical protein